VRTPIRPLPESVARWTAGARYLRWLDGLAAWAALWIVLATLQPDAAATAQAVLAAVLVGLGRLAPPVRTRWRPGSGLAGLLLSRTLRPGDRAWYVRPGQAQAVLVAARHGARMVIAVPGQDAAEGISVRRTRVLLLPAD